MTELSILNTTYLQFKHLLLEDHCQFHELEDLWKSLS